MKDDVISRQAAIAVASRECHEFRGIFADIEKGLNHLPSVQPLKGKWIYGEHESSMCDGYRCDKCGFFVPWDYQHKFIDFIKDYNFCPACGSDMREGEQDV